MNSSLDTLTKDEAEAYLRMLPRELAYLQDRLTELDLQCKTLDTARQIKKVREDIAARQMDALYLMERHDLSGVPTSCEAKLDNALTQSPKSFHQWLDHAVAEAGINEASVAEEYRSMQEDGYQNCHDELRRQLVDQITYALEQTMPLPGDYTGMSPLQDYIIEQRTDRILHGALPAEGMMAQITSDDDEDDLIPTGVQLPSPHM